MIPNTTFKDFSKYALAPVKILKDESSSHEYPDLGVQLMYFHARKEVGVLHESMTFITKGEEMEKEGFEAPDFLPVVHLLNASGFIGQRCFNLFQQDQPTNTGYLKMTEVLMRSGIFNLIGMEPKVTIFKVNQNDFDKCLNTTVPKIKAVLVPLPDHKLDGVFSLEFSSNFKTELGDELLDVMIIDCTRSGIRESAKSEEQREWEENQRFFSGLGLAINVLRPGGSLVMETRGNDTVFFGSSLFIMSCCFRKVSCIKTTVSLDSERKLFIVGNGFGLPPGQCLMDNVQLVMDIVANSTFIERNNFFPIDFIPDQFQISLKTALEPYLKYVGECKQRNYLYWKNKNVDIDQVLNYQKQISNEWLLQVPLQLKYYGPYEPLDFDENLEVIE